ncbi:MAG: lipid-binding SYLF domain-containing protein [Acidobacteriia bacterium]|nr:lipid-binding SYLF domain-containing protein [Terriglobia bacterium]
MKTGWVCLLSAATLLAQTDTSRVNPNASNEVKRVQGATAAFDEMMHAKDGGIAQDILEKSQCIGIVPNLKRAAFFIGGQYGRGIVTCRVSETRWSAPAMIAIEGGSIGVQFGAGETDLVFAVMNRSGMDKLMQDKFAIGANVTGAIGPIGREVQAETDAMMRAEVLSWSRARGVFAGVSLQGATIHPDKDADANLYGHDVSFRAVLDGHGKPPAVAQPLLTTLSRYVPKQSRTGE